MSSLLQRYVCTRSPLAQFMTLGVPKFLFSGILALSAILSGTASAQTGYYVSSQNGNDSWSGLLPSPNSTYSDGPFQSLARAQAKMESSSIKTVNLRAGTYSISSSLQLNSSDSGETWTSYPGENPVMDGGGGGIVALYGNNLTLEGITFQNMGQGGVVYHGAANTTLRWNTFNNCNLMCISGSTSGSTIDSNIVNGQSQGSTAAGYAIQLWSGSSNNQITHNLIQNCVGGAVNIATGPNDRPTNNNLVDRNILNNIDTNSYDAAAIYMVDANHSSVGNKITNNIINGVGGSGYLTNITKGIYLDAFMSNVVVSGNICRFCGTFAWQIHGGDHNSIVNNIFHLGSQPGPVNETGGDPIGNLAGLYQTENTPPVTADWGMAGNVIEKNIIYLSGTVPWDLYQVNLLSGDAAPYTSGNLYYAASGASIPNSSTWAAVNVIVDTNPVYANPEFASPSAGNYSMPSSSPAYTAIGFQALPTDQGPVSRGPVVTGGSGVLTGSGNSATTTVNLTAQGTADWVHWGNISLIRKNGVSPQISNYSIVGSSTLVYVYNNDPRVLSWNDGNPIFSGTARDGVYIYSPQNGFAFTVPAGTGMHTLTVYVGGWNSGGTLTAHLSDGSAADFVDATSNANGSYDRNYTLTYHAGSAGQALTVHWVQNSGYGNVTLNGAALQ